MLVWDIAFSANSQYTITGWCQKKNLFLEHRLLISLDIFSAGCASVRLCVHVCYLPNQESRTVFPLLLLYKRSSSSNGLIGAQWNAMLPTISRLYGRMRIANDRFVAVLHPPTSICKKIGFMRFWLFIANVFSFFHYIAPLSVTCSTCDPVQLLRTIEQKGC